MRLLVAAFLLLAALANADGAEPVCAKTCSSTSDGLSGYRAGQQYVYLYRGEAATTTAGEQHQSSLSVAARVVFTVGASPCDLRLQVPSLEVEGDSAWFKEAVQAHDLYFSYQGGRIEEVCPHEEEAAAATNFKRAVLSMLHTTVANPPARVIVLESDVAGECETHYHLLSSEDDKVVLNKTKHDCLFNVHLPHLPHSPSHSPHLSVIPHFRSNQECQMESLRGVWQSVECQQQVDVDGPLAPSKGSVTLAMSSSLVLETTRPDGNRHAFHQEKMIRRESLRMNLEKARTLGQPQESSHILEQIADTMVVLAKEEGKKEVEWPRIFSHLVDLMGFLQHQEDLQDMWDTYSGQDNYKNVVLDGLLACDSGPCVELVAHLAAEVPSPLSSTTLSSWLAGLHLQSHADPSSITHIMSLVESRGESEDAAVMAASSVVFRVCHKDQRGCHSHARMFLKYVKDEVGKECGWGQTREQQQRVKLALQALGNAGVVPKDHFPERCYKNKLLPTELRVAALQTLRRSGCSGSEAPWMVLEDGNDRVEVRVAAYMALQPCAITNPQFFPRLQKLLEKEQVNQVGSFIWTHVRNLVEQPEASQEGQEVARLAAQLTLNNKFNTNPFQASRNYRLAQFSEVLGIGGAVDGNVIFSPESYLPRTAALNLTLQLLGKSVNVFEVGGSFKGLEDYIERFFEKGKYFENEEIQKLLQNLRPKREASMDKFEEYQTMYNEAKMKKEAIEGREEGPKTSLYLRVFGNEMIHSENVLKSDPLKVIQDTLQHLSSPRAFQVMNQEFVTPTLLGFPLKLKYNVTGSLSLNKEGRLQALSPGQFLLEGKLSPTVAVTADETLLLDGYGFHSGIRRSTTHHAHSHLGGKISIHDGHLVDAQLDLPKTEVVKIYSSVKIALYSNTDQGWSELATHINPEESEGCSSKGLSDITGLQVCHVERSVKQLTDGDVADSEPYERKIVISKTDNFDKFVFSLRKADNTFEAVVDTPGSSVDRRVSVVVNSRRDGMGSTIVVPRRQVEGEYQWSPSLKKVALKYYQDSEVHGELDVSLLAMKEGLNMRHTPHIVVSLPGLLEVRANGSLLLGPENLAWNGTFMSSLQNHQADSQGHWEVVGEHQRASARVTVGQNFGSVSGSVLSESAMTVVDAKCEYGTDSTQPNTLSLNAHFTEKLENKEKLLQGHISVESNQAEASVNMDVRHQLGHTAINASLSLPSAMINSTFVAKNIGEEEKRDFEMAFSVFSPQLALNYLGRTLYKASDGDFQAEAEVRLGMLGHTKVSVSHVLQCQPFHALAGLHLQFNDHLLQAGYNVDFSQPDHIEMMVSGAVGAASAVFHMEADHSHSRPFRGLLKVFGGYDGKQVGAMLHTASDATWQSFNGSVELTWFEQSHVVRHETLWSDSRKGITLSRDQSSFQLMYESSPSPRVFVVMKPSTYPTLQVVAEKTEDVRSKTYQAYFMQGADRPLHISATWNKNQSFSGSLRLLKSEARLSGSLTHPRPHHLEGSAQVTVVLPSSETFTTDFTISHAYDGTTRELNVSSVSNGLIYEGKMKLKQYDGWFSNDSLILTVNLTTPLAGLHSAVLLLETHSDPSQVNFIQLEFEEIKVRGEAQVGDPANLFDVKLQYEAGRGSCDSHIHLYHKYVHEKYLTGATVRLTQEHEPWGLQVVTVLGDTHGKKSLEAEFTSPLLSSPFHFHANYSKSEGNLDLKLQGGMESQASLTLSGKNDLQGNTQIYGGTLDLQSPWTSPLFINMSHHHGEHGLNMTLDFRSAWHPVNNVKADFGVTFVNSSDLEAHFQLNHEHLQVIMDLAHRLTKDGLSNQLEFSASDVRVTSKIICTWDENFVPQSATGHLSVINVFDEPQDFSFSFIKGISDFHTQLLASRGNNLLRVEHQLQMNHRLDWVSVLNVVLPNREDIMENKMTLNVMPYLSSVNWEFSIKSPWTEEIKSHFSSEKVSSQRETKFVAVYGGSPQAELTLKTPEPFNWYQSNISLNISSSHFSAIDVHWKHKFGNENIVTAEIFVDGEFYLKGEQKLMLSKSKLTQSFEQFHFVFMVNIPSKDFDFETKLLFNSNLSGEFEVESGDFLVYVTSLHNAGELLSFVIQGPLVEWKATLTNDPGPSSLPNLLLNVTRDGTDIFTFGSKFAELYPKLDGLFTVSVRFENENFVKNGELHIVADMSRIEYYAFKGIAKLNSNFEGFEKYWVELDTDINNEQGALNGSLSGALHIGDWQYRTNIQALLELHHNVSLSYNKKYTLMHQQQVLDKKEIRLFFLVNKMDLVFGNITVITGPQAPQWGLFMTYNPEIKEFKAYAIPGNERKYQVMARVDSNVFKIDCQIVSKDRPEFKVIAGDISWTFRRRRRLIKIDLNSDFSVIQSIKGFIGIQRRRKLGVSTKLMVNEAEFNGNMTYIPASPRSPARVSLELKNEVFMPFKTDINLTYSLSPSNLESSLVIDLNEEKNWLKADAKGSLDESYIMLKLPYKDFENVTISLKISTEQFWGVEANVLLPQLCVNVEGKVHPKLKFVLVSTKVLGDCENELFDFHFSYEIDRDSFNVTSHCHLLQYGTIYRFEAAGKSTKSREFHLKSEMEVYSLFSLGLELSSVIEEEGRSLTINIYDPVSDWTHFLYKDSIKSNKTDVIIEMNQRAVLSLKAYHSFRAVKFDLNGTFSHSFSYLPFSATLTASGKMEEKQGEINLGLSTSSPRFSQADIQATYKFEENKEVTFKLLSPLGNAEGNIVLQEAVDVTSITLDMTSSLHSFQDYNIKLTHKTEGNNHHFSALSIQDDLKLELTVSFLAKAEGFLTSLRIASPFKLLETLHVSLGFPHSNSSRNLYTFDIHGITNGDGYELTFIHDHNSLWHTQNTTMMVSTPSGSFGNFSLNAVYDVSSHASIHLGTPEGDTSFKADWQDSETQFIFNSSFNLSHFGLGKYVLHCDIPRTASRKGVIQFEYSQPHINYTCQLQGGRNFNFGKLILNVNDPRWTLNKTTYSFGYDLYHKKNLINLEGQYKEVEASAVIKLKRNTLPPLSGTLKVQTNINKFEVINGSWNIGRREQAYIVEAKLDIGEQSVLSLRTQFNSQPQGASAPWDKLELDVLFESSLTLTHHLHAEYEVSTWNLSSWYKHGLDHFHLKLIPRLKRKVGTLLVTGNIPVRGLSTFNLEFNYNFKEVYTASLIASIEETNLISSVELEPRRSWSSLKASLTSPFFRPMRASLLWTFKELPWLVESSVTYGTHVGELKIKAKPYGNSKLLELQMNLPFDFLFKSLFTAKYSTNQAGDILASAEVGVNNHTLSAESKIKYNNEITKLEFMGLENVSGIERRLEMIYENMGSQHTASVTWVGHESFIISLVEIKKFWNEEAYLNMSGSLTPHDDSYNLQLTIESSETKPVVLKSRYSHKDGQEGTAFLSVGEREYNVSVKGDISKKSSNLEFQLLSSESIHTPMIFKAEYNLSDYIGGRMTSMMDLASVTFEWGESIQLLVHGMQNRNQSKMKFEMLTPFRSLPRLTFGYDSEFSLARSNIEIMCTISVEWSQKITFTGIFKLVNGNVDTFVGLTSSYSDLEMLDTTLRFNSSRIEAITTVNQDKWNVTCDYQLDPFSVAVSVNTPFEGCKTVSFAASGTLHDGHLSAEAELTWTSTIKVQMEAELWDLDVKLHTPWSLLQEASLKMSLRTESEALMYTASAHWNHSTIIMEAIYSPLQLKIIGEYKEESTEIGFIMFEYAFSLRKYKAAVQIRTPFVSFKSLEIELNIKPKVHEFMIGFITDNFENTLQLSYSKKQGNLKVHLPMLSKFMWTLEAKKMWLELNTEASASLGEMSSPMKVSFSYVFSPEDRKANISVRSEFPHKLMKSLNLNIIVTYDGTSVEVSSSAMWKLHDEEPTNLNGSLTSNIKKKNLSIEMKLEGNCFEYPVKLTCKIPLFNFFVKEGAFELIVIHEETYLVMYKARNGDEVYALHHFTIETPNWSFTAELILKEESFNLSVTFPDSSRRHTLTVKWPHISLENFAASMELHSPYLPQEGVMINGNLIVAQKFSFSLNSTASYGQNFITVTGMLQYTKKLRELKCEGKILSNWIENHQLEANVQWLRNIKANIQLEISDEEHNCSLVIDVTKYTVELKCSSSWLPYGSCTVRGKINNDLSISKIEAEGQLTGFTEGESLTIEASVSEDDPGRLSGSVTVKQGSQQLHHVSANVNLRKTSLEIRFVIQSDDPRLKTRFLLHIENNSERRYLSAVISNYYIPYTKLDIVNSKNWRKMQLIKFFSSKSEFQLGSEIGKTSGYLVLDLELFSFEFEGSAYYDLSSEYSFEVKVDTSLDTLQSLIFKIQFPTDGNTQLLKLYLISKNDQETRVDIHCFPDPVMKWSVWVSISTPLSGFEKFQLITPQFNYQSHIFRALFEYPGWKVGSILTSSYSNKRSPNMQFSLYLPFEKYDIISLKIIDTNSLVSGKKYYAAEMRVGKVGITVALKDLSIRNFFNLEFLVKLNEWSMKTNLRSTWKRGNVKIKLYMDFIPKDILGFQFFSTQFRYNKKEELFFFAKSDSKELVKAHWSWGEDKIFSLITPRIYPGYLVFHLESGPVVQECQVKASLSTAAGGSGSPYGFHIHHSQLEAGHHISLLALAPQKHFYLEVTHHMNSKLLNESLIIEVNKKQVGYKAYLKKDPGLFTSTYTGGMSLMLPVHSVHFNTSVASAIRGIDFSSMLTWGKIRSLRQPLNLKLKYNDYSVFNKGRHHLSAMLSHPDIKDITLQANITRTHNSSLHASAELVDGNSPEMKVVATMEVEPVRDDGRQTVSLSLYQPVSNFTMLLEAQLRQDPLTEALCKLKYYSLASETWHQVNLSASVESHGNGRALTVAVVTPQNEWGRTWRGALDSRPEEASFSLEGSSLELGDTWKLGSVVKRHVPELLVYLSVGKELEVYEEARVRLGLHSPVEAGAALDHLRFGEWHLDAALGLRLTSPHVLQAFLDFDPSLDYKDEGFVTRLASPLHKFLQAWQQDVISTVLDISQWIESEGPTLSQVIVNKQVLKTMWNSEINSFFDFLGEAEGVISHVSGQTSLFWRELMMPRLQEGFRLISTIHEWAQASLQHAVHRISLLPHRWTAGLESRWRVISYHLASLHHRMKVWWAQTEAEVEVYLHAAMYWIARSVNLTTAAVQEWVAALRDTFQPHLHTLSWITARYGQELSNTLTSECWWPVQHMGNQLHHSLTQVLESSWIVFREFLQPETTIPMLTQASQYVRSQAQQTLTIIQDGLQQLKESVPDTPSFTFVSQLFQNLEALVRHSLPVLYDLMENGVPGLVPHITSLVDKVMSLIEERITAMQRYSGGTIFYSYINAVFGSLYDKLLVTWQSWKEKDHTVDTTTKLLMEVIKKVLNLDNDIFMESYVFEPVRGQVVYNQHLPVMWPSFLHAPHWHSLIWQSGVREAQRILQEGVDMTSSTWGTLWLPGSLFPPFTATATIMGQHITTFDLHHYQFLGPCSYLLARDFVGGDFSVVGVYQAQAGVVGLASIQVHTPSRTFVLNVNGSVDASQPHSEMYSAGSQSSLKVGGLLVSCDQVTRGCSITVSNKYFGRLAGLLGNYNHEQADDSRSPDGQPVSSPAQLATRWAVGGEPCYQANQAVQLKVESAGVESVAECSLLFLKGNSPFSRCFYSVNPQPYFTHCISNKRHTRGGGGREKSSHDVCGAVTAYVTQCLAQGISLPYPDKCKRGKERSSIAAPVLSGSCEVPGGKPVPSQWSKTFQGETQGSADLAFIIELANCNKGKNMQQLLQLLKVHIRRAGSEDVRYALLTAREGSVGEPSSFMKEEDMLTLLNTLDLQGPKDDQGGAAAIISAAKRLKWRPGVSRTIVQLSCRPCDAGEVVHQALQENDVTFHLVTKHKVTMAGADPKKREVMARKLLGFDNKYGYTVRDIKKFSGTEKLRAALQEPEGSCVMAAQASGGSVFNMNKWLPNKEVLAKKFLRVLSHRVAVSTSAPECQKCQCVGGATEMKLQCRKCSTEFTVPQEMVTEGPHSSVWQQGGKKNYTIKVDIMKNFVHQFVDENAALAVIENRSENDNLYESVDEEANSSEEEETEEEEEDEGYGDYEDNSYTQNYYNYEAGY